MPSHNYESRSKRAGLIFPVGRALRKLKNERYTQRTSPDAAVFLTAVIQHLVSDVLELSSKAACQNLNTRITPRHLLLAIRNDNELGSLFSNVTISRGGVSPNILPALLPRYKRRL